MKGKSMAGNKLVNKFCEILGKQNVFQDEADRLAYSYDAAVLDPSLPSLVLRPTTSEALGHAVGLCNENVLPTTVRGSGTNLSGGTDSKARRCRDSDYGAGPNSRDKRRRPLRGGSTRRDNR